MTLDQLVVWVKQLINKKPATAADDTGDPSNATIIAFINVARNELYNRFAAQFPTRFTTNADDTYTANALQMTMPTSLFGRQIVSVFWYTTDISTAMPLSCKNIAELPNLSGLSGTPRAYSVEGTRIYLRPIPAVNTSLRYVYIPAPTALASGSDTPSEFPVDQHALIGTLAAAKIAARNMDDTAQGLDALAKEGINQLHDAMRSMVGDDGYVINAPPGPFEVY